MRDVYLWSAYVVGSAAAAVTISFVVSRILNTRRERRYVPPSVLYTEVRPFAQPVETSIEEEFPPFDVLLDQARAIGRTPRDVPAWALDALSDVRKTASEDTYATLGEYAGARPQAAAIWCDMVGRRTVLGLVTA